VNRFLCASYVVLALTGCQKADENLTARVEALEARYHTQGRQIEELQAAVKALSEAKPAPVVDLVGAP